MSFIDQTPDLLHTDEVKAQTTKTSYSQIHEFQPFQKSNTMLENEMFELAEAQIKNDEAFTPDSMLIFGAPKLSEFSDIKTPRV